jgi:hypothetical protein
VKRLEDLERALDEQGSVTADDARWLIASTRWLHGVVLGLDYQPTDPPTKAYGREGLRHWEQSETP